MENNAPKLTVGPVSNSILSMMLPMALGILVMIGNGLVDAYFIGQLGYAQLAAVSYAFPVWFVAAGIVMGLGTGTSSVLSRFIGSGDTKSVKQIATHSMVLAVLAGAVVTAIGLLSIESLFGLLGANEESMPYVKSYMTIYYWGSLFLGIPFIGNAILRANGDAKTPSMLVAFSAIVNAVLDPILIFGWFGFPEMGVAGAALASVISTVAFLFASLWVLILAAISACVGGGEIRPEPSTIRPAWASRNNSACIRSFTPKVLNSTTRSFNIRITPTISLITFNARTGCSTSRSLKVSLGICATMVRFIATIVADLGSPSMAAYSPK